MSFADTLATWLQDSEIGEGDPVKVVAKVLHQLGKTTDLFLVEGVEKRLWELIKVNRRKAREGAGVKKGFFSQAKKVDGGSKPSKDVVEEIVNPGLSSLDQKLKVDAEEAEKKVVSGLAAQESEGDGKETQLEEVEEDEGKGLVPNSGNGYSYESGHTWVQTLQDVTYTIPVPAGTKARDLVVDIRKTRLKVVLKSPSGLEPLVDDDLHKEIAVEDSFWNINDGKELELYLQKVDTMCWWDKVCSKQEGINTKKVEPENSKLSDLDAETRQTVEKMMFDQKQKAMGMPTSEEQQKEDMMKKFMDAHPEMDFSKAKFM